DNDEILIGFTRGNATGRARLRRITPQPLQTTSLVPFLLKAQMDPPQVREEIRQAWEMPLEPDTVPASEPMSPASAETSPVPSPGPLAGQPGLVPAVPAGNTSGARPYPPRGRSTYQSVMIAPSSSRIARTISHE